jgi:hypothetical protein
MNLNKETRICAWCARPFATYAILPPDTFNTCTPDCRRALMRARKRIARGLPGVPLPKPIHAHVPAPLTQNALDRKRYASATVLAQAVKSGRITRPDHCTRCHKPCKPHGHHTDYMLQTEVAWLCAKCHAQEHRHNRNAPRMPLECPRTRVTP